MAGKRMKAANASYDKNAAHSVADAVKIVKDNAKVKFCLLYTSPSPRDATLSRMPSSA